MTKPTVSVSDVTKCYGEVEALEKISLSMNPGGLSGIIGPDGAGKSMLFRIPTTLLLADSRAVTMNGPDTAKDYKQIQQRVGYMPGCLSFYQSLTVEENLDFLTTVFHAIIHESCNSMKDIYQQIKPFRERKAGVPLGGMKQKLTLDRALIHKSSILFLDESTTGVDLVSHKEFWETLGRLEEQGITIPASTPIMDEVRQRGRITLINEGETQGIDAPERILKQPSYILCPPGLERVGVRAENDFAIEIDRLIKCFRHLTAVNHTSFQANRGEIFGFLRANGAGRITAMHMPYGLSKPTFGVARIAGLGAAIHPEKAKKSIGHMGQKFSLYEDFKVQENIHPFTGIHGVQDHETAEKIDVLLDCLGLNDERGILVKSLPLGQK